MIHPQACVSDDCIIGEGTRIWQFASVIRGARLGRDCNVASGATIDGSVFGDRCIICHNVAMGPGFLFGDDCFIGPNTTICNDAWPRAVKTGFDPQRFDGEHWAIIVEDGAAIGANCVVLPGVRIGAGAMIPAGVTVSKDVPAGHIMLSDQTVFPIGDDEAKLMKRMRFAPDVCRTPTWAESVQAKREADARMAEVFGQMANDLIDKVIIR